MNFFTEHSTFLLWGGIIIGGIIFCLLLKGWRTWCKHMKRYDEIQEKEMLKDFHEPNIEEYHGTQ